MVTKMENELLELIKTRRSIRAFSDKEISRKDLDIITEAAIYAPSAMNKQTWQFTVVTDKSKISALAAAVGKALGRDGYCMYDPQAIIICSNEINSRWGADDCACAAENMFLAAHAIGIGSVWINQVRDADNIPEVRNILSELQIPEDHKVYGTVALGYSKGEDAIRQTVKNYDRIKWN